MRSLIITLSILAWSSTAWGHGLPRPARGGFTLELGLGGNLVLEDDYYPRSPIFGRGQLDPMVGLSLGLLGRVNRFFSLGFLGHYGFLDPVDDGLREEYADFVAALLEARVHIGIKRFEPWFGFGFGYAMTHVHGERRSPLGYDVDVALHGVGLGISTGFNIYLWNHLSVGPFFRAVVGLWPTVCHAQGSHSECERLDDHYGEAFDDVPHLISFGATIANTF